MENRSMIFRMRPFSTCYKVLLIVSSILLPAACLLAEETPPAVPVNPKLLNADLLERGRVVYENNCIGCHGAKGDGEGPAASRLNPRPRDFTAGTFKFRSTMSGTLPTDEDLFRTIRQGALGSAMPSYRLMPDRDVLAVIQYLKTFSPLWTDAANFGKPVAIPYPPSWINDETQLQAHAADGRKVFVQTCASCHGEGGAGDGPSSQQLTDRWDNPIRPTDLRKPYIRSGRNITDIYKVMVTGVSGAPMPSYYDTTTETQRWDLVAYILKLRKDYKAASANQ